MDILLAYSSDSLIHAVGWALIHSLWQGAAVAVLLLVVLRATTPGPGAGVSSRTRYILGCVSLVAVVGMIVLTCVHYAGTRQTPQWPPAVTGAAITTELTTINVAPPLSNELLVTAEQTIGPLDRVERYLPWMVLAWLAGMVIVSLRMLTGWGLLRRICFRGVSPISPALQARVSALCQTMKVKQVVRVLESSRAVTPMVVGWVRPIILLPSACLTGLSSQQLAAVIAHELAHVLRHDYFVNLLQCVIETLLFYHPAVWWIGRVIRQERERCCDDLAVHVSGDRVDYARALLRIAESAPPHRGRLSVASQGGDLSRRVRRLLGVPSPPSQGRWTAGLWTAVAALCLVTVFVVGVQADSDGVVNEEAKPEASVTTTDPTSPDAESKAKQRIIEIPYQKLIDGDPAYNIVIRPGDVIRIAPSGGFVYLGGEVNRPGAYNIPGGNDLTLKQLIVSGGGIDNPNRFAKIVRRLGPDAEETLHFSLDDIFEGWSQDTFLAPNDVILITSQPEQEDEQAKERRLLRERLLGLKSELMRLHEQLENATHEFGDGHRLTESINSNIKTAETELAEIKKQLRPEEKSLVMKILPAPMQRAVGSPPRPEDLVVKPLLNTAEPLDRVNLDASPAKGHAFQVTIVRLLDDKGELSIPGIASTRFVGRPINEVEAEILSKMQGHEDYRQVGRVTITLPDKWTCTLIASDLIKARSGLHTIPRAEFRLKELLMRQTDMPKGLRVLVIRQEPIQLTPTQP